MKVFKLILVWIILGGNILTAQPSIRLYAMGHSLIDHRPPAIPTPGDETTIIFWMYDMALAAGYDFAAGGQYGFLDTHAHLPPAFNWWYDEVPGVWDEATMNTFSDADINTLLLTAANFIQYQPASEPYPLDETTTALALTETIFDWIHEQEEGANFYIYANWPEMDLQNAFPGTLPLQSEIDGFHTYTMGDFTSWWIDYQDSLLVSRPELNVRLIPVGATISKVLTEVIPNQIPFDELYEDAAPHGRPTIYFLAAMITYMAIYEEEVPADYMPGNLVHEAIRNNFIAIRDYIWQALNDFNLPNGQSRVFASPVMNANNENLERKDIEIFPNPSTGQIALSGNREGYFLKIMDIYGHTLLKNEYIAASKELDISSLPNGLYFIQFWDKVSGIKVVKRIMKVN